MPREPHPTCWSPLFRSLVVLGLLLPSCGKHGDADGAETNALDSSSAAGVGSGSPTMRVGSNPNASGASAEALVLGPGGDPLTVDISQLDAPVVAKIEESRAAVAVDPSNPLRWVYLAHTFAANHIPSPAIAAYERALELDAENAKIWYQLALAQHEGAQTLEALDSIEAALARDTSVPAYHWRRANWLFDEGRIEEARRGYETALRLDPNDAAAVAGMARVRLDRDQPERTIEDLKRVLRAAGDAPYTNYIRRLLATAYRRVDQEEKAGALEVLGTEGPPVWNDPAQLEVSRFQVQGVYHLAARAAYLANEGRFDEAAEQMREFLRHKPDETAPRNQLARFLDFAGRRDEAAAEYRRTLEISPNDREALVQLGKLLGQSGRAAEGLALLEKALAIEPLYAQAHFFRGSVLRRMGRIREAATSYRRAVELDETHAKSWVAVGLLEAELEDWESALQAFQRAEVLGQDRGDMWLGMARCLLALGRADEAQTALEQGRAKEPFDQAGWMEVSAAVRQAQAKGGAQTEEGSR